MSVKVHFRPLFKISQFYVILITKRLGTFAYSAFMIIFTSKHNALGFRISTVQTANKGKGKDSGFRFSKFYFQVHRTLQFAVCTVEIRKPIVLCLEVKMTMYALRDVRNELLISIWRLQISSLPKSTHFMPSKYCSWLEMQSFSRCIHFLKASRYADLGTVINKVLMNGRSKCLSGLVFPPSKECFQFRKQKEITWGKVWGIRGMRQNSYFFFLQKRPIAEVWAGALSCRRRTCLKPVAGRRFW